MTEPTVYNLSIAGVRHYLRIYRGYLGRRLYLVFGLTLLAAVAEGLGIALLLPLIEAADAGAADHDSAITRGISAFLGTLGLDSSLGVILLLIGTAFVLKGGVTFAERAYKAHLQAQLFRELKTRMYDAYNAMDYRYFIKRNTGHFVNVINAQIGQTIGSFDRFLSFLNQVIMALSYLGFALLIEWTFALMAATMGGILMLLFKTLNRYVIGLSRKTASEASTLNKFLVQTLQAFKYVTATGQTEHLRESVVESVGKLAGYRKKQQVAYAFTTAIKEPVSVVFMIGIVAVHVLALGAAIAPIAVALLLFYRGMRAIINVQESWQQTMNAVGSLEMVEDELEATAANTEADGEKPIGPFSKGIELENVTFSYDPAESPVIRNLSLSIPANHTVALVGESGAGKTTVADLITLILQPSSGRITIDDTPAELVRRRSWRHQIGYVSQETVVFDDTIANNISLWAGNYSEDRNIRERVEEAACKAYADIFIRDLPAGYETVVGDRGVRLSGGQCQRLFIARELFKNPNLLILDEATSALDSESEQCIQRAIDALKGSMTVVMIAHRLSTIRNADLIYVLSEGRVVEQGSYEELTGNVENRFSRMVRVQQV